MIAFLTIALMIISILLVMIVLVQRGRGGGLAGAFGSGGGSNSAFGTKTGDVFTTATVILFVVFVLCSIWLSYAFHPSGTATTAPAPAAIPMPAGAPATPGAPAAPSQSAPATGSQPATQMTAPASIGMAPATTATSQPR